MQVHFGTELLHAEWSSAVACVGTFDGVHLGHQTLIREAVAKAKGLELPTIVVTFDRHPAAVLAPERAPKAIASIEENLAQFQKLGVAVAVILPFDAALSRMSADKFLNDVLRRDMRASEIVVGHDFAMGNGREGTTSWLQARIPTDVIPPFEVDGARVSSSAIREAVVAGHMDVAAKLLGRGFVVSGVVVSGERLGRQLGFPTANLARSFDQVMPADGVYAGEMETPYGVFRAAASIGCRPAVGGVSRTIEAYLLDYPGQSLYGCHVRLRLDAWLRAESDFPSLDALVKQIEQDVQQVRRLGGLSLEL
jgi:riboflavin kinase/FMN adenylyltransferase